MVAAGRESLPRRRSLSVLGDGDPMVFHSLGLDEAS